MAPLSILPGRIRFENSSLIGKEKECRQLEQRMSCWDEVRSVKVNHRTGRVLVQFDEGSIDRNELVQKVGAQLAEKIMPSDEVPHVEVPDLHPLSKKNSIKPLSQHLLKEILAHAFLPAPLDLLIPAMAVFRK